MGWGGTGGKARMASRSAASAWAAASRCAAVMQDERSTDETCMWIHKRVSVLANSVAEALLGAGIDVDLRAYLELPQDDGTDMNDNRE